jgi:hypothetical protein
MAFARPKGDDEKPSAAPSYGPRKINTGRGADRGKTEKNLDRPDVAMSTGVRELNQVEPWRAEFI